MRHGLIQFASIFCQQDRSWTICPVGAACARIAPRSHQITWSLNRSFAEALALGARVEPDGEITGVDGNPIPLMRGQIDNAQIGPWRWDNRELHVAELALFGRMGAPSEHFMLLGMDWLDGRRFAIDYGTEEVWLGR
jgi:hypothetical protein